MRKIKKLILIGIASIIVILSAYIYHGHTKYSSPPVPKTDVVYTAPPKSSNTTNSNSNLSENKPIPASLLIKVPFTVQAPTANWDELHNEACEEASSIMTHAYFDHIDLLTPNLVESEISKLTNWQDKIQGYHLDQSSLETAKMIETVYGLHSEIDNLSENLIKKSLTQNKLVIISFNGQLLHNPHYKQPGPIHHMLVVTGWTQEGKYITNDSGTKFGENYQYDWATLEAAAADWDHNINTVNNSKKLAIIISN